MGLVIDTDVWVLAEKTGGQLALARWAQYGKKTHDKRETERTNEAKKEIRREMKNRR